MDLNQEEMAELIGCDQTSVSQWETGRAGISVARCLKLLRLATTKAERVPILARLSALDVEGPELARLMQKYRLEEAKSTCGIEVV